MGVVNVPGYGPIDFGDKSNDEIAAAIKKMGPPPAGAQAAAPAPAPATPPPRNYDLGDIPGAAASNLGRSAGEFGTNLLNMVLHPIDTATSVGNLGLGVLSKLNSAGNVPSSADQMQSGQAPYVAPVETPEQQAERARVEAPINAVAADLKNRWGGYENIKRTLAEDPFGAAFDIGSLFSGGEGLLAKTPLVGEKLAATARFANPTTAPFRTAGWLAGKGADFGGYLSGTGGTAIRDAATASEGSIPWLRPTPASEAFTGQMTGARPATEVADLGKSAIAKMEQEGKDNYNRQIAALGPNYKTNPVTWGGINQAVEDAKDVSMSRSPGATTGIIRNQAAEDVRTAAEAKINEFKNSKDPYHQTPAGLDDLKKAIYTIPANTPQELKVRTDIYNKVQAEIERQFPKYADAMADYHGVMKQSDQLERMFSLGPNAMDNTAVGKLQKVGRNNVTTNYGAMKQALDKLTQYEPTLPAALAGQNLSSWAPRGVTTTGVVKGALGLSGFEAAQHLLSGGHFSLPQILSALGTAVAGGAATSPRIWGNIAQRAGQLRAPLKAIPSGPTAVTGGLLNELQSVQPDQQ